MARVRDFDGVGRVLTRSHREGISFFSLQTYAHLRDLFIHLPAVVSPASNAISCIPKQHARTIYQEMLGQTRRNFCDVCTGAQRLSPETPWRLSTKKETSTRRLQNRVASDDASGARHQKKRAPSCCLLGKREIVDKHRDRLLLPAPFSIREYERVWPSLCACSDPEPRTNVCVF